MSAIRNPQSAILSRTLTRRQALLSLGMVASARAGAGAEPGKRFESSIEVVTVTVAVTDAEGRLVTDLAQDEFELFEDGLPQTITQFTRIACPSAWPCCSTSATAWWACG